MTKVIITKRYSGFRNVSDDYVLGNREHFGQAAAKEYVLPEGYTVQDDRVYDSDDIECALVPDDDGAPMLISLKGRCPSHRLMEG